MTKIKCSVTPCEFNKDETCTSDEIEMEFIDISDKEYPYTPSLATNCKTGQMSYAKLELRLFKEREKLMGKQQITNVLDQLRAIYRIDRELHPWWEPFYNGTDTE